MAAIVARGVSKRFGDRAAIADVDLDVAEGEVRGLLGPNGAGKTTLLRALLGLVRPDAGQISLLGRTADESRPTDLEGVAGIVEEPRFYPYLSARANLEVLARLDDRGAPARIDETLELVRLTSRSRDRVSGYSSGMRQRLGIAAAVMRDPRLMLLDEPIAGLDMDGIRLVAELVSALAQDGVAVLLSSHQIAELASMCDAFTVLSEGRVVWDGSAAAMRSQAPPPTYRVFTSDEAVAAAICSNLEGVLVEPAPEGGLRVRATEQKLDELVLAFAGSHVAVRRLELAISPLESMFSSLTGGAHTGAV
jgi:ABC-2 type transport system ATP-binding protein